MFNNVSAQVFIILCKFGIFQDVFLNHKKIRMITDYIKMHAFKYDIRNMFAFL